MPPTPAFDKVVEELAAFNQKARNAGMDFKAEVDPVSRGDSRSILILGSVDFAYYVNLHLNFWGVTWTSLSDGESWPDAWHSDQLALATEEERQQLMANEGIDISPESLVFFVIKDRVPREKTCIVCRSFSLNWYTG